MFEIKYLVFFTVLILGVPAGYYLSRMNKYAEYFFFFLAIFFTCRMIDINFVSMETYRGTRKGFEFGMVDITTYILLALVISRRHIYPVIAFPPGTILYGLYFLISLVSTINADVLVYSAFELVMMIRMYLYYWVMVNYIRTEKQLQLLMVFFGTIIFYVFSSVIYQKYVLHFFQNMGPFPHQNSMVMYMSVLGALSFSYLLNVGKSNSVIWFTLFGMTGICIIASLSRAGMALFAINCLLVFVLSSLSGTPNRQLKMRRLLLLAVLPVCAGLVLAKSYDTIVERFTTAPEESKNVRVNLAIAAARMANDKIFGIGLNNFALKINPPYPYSSHIPRHESTNRDRDAEEKGGLVETTYLMIAAETGWLNLVIFICLLMSFYIRNLVNFFHYRKTWLRFLCIAFIGALTSIYLQSCLEWVLKQTNNFYQLMLVFAVISVMTRMRKMAARRKHHVAITA